MIITVSIPVTVSNLGDHLNALSRQFINFLRFIISKIQFRLLNRDVANLQSTAAFIISLNRRNKKKANAQKPLNNK